MSFTEYPPAINDKPVRKTVRQRLAENREKSKQKSTPRKDAGHRKTKKTNSSPLTCSNSEVRISDISDDSFGDQERKICQTFRDNLKSSVSSDADQIEETYLLALADVFRKSSLATANYTNILKACGLYNLCLRRNSGKETIRDTLTHYETEVMKKLLKLKPAQIEKWVTAREATIQDLEGHLQELRQLYLADFTLILTSVQDFPSASMIMEDEEPTRRILVADDKILAVYHLMQMESGNRLSLIISDLWTAVTSILGPPPCKFALVGKGLLASQQITPFEPFSVTILLEKESPGLKAYFKNAMTLFSMLTLSFQQTSLQLLKIRTLNWYNNQQTQVSGFSLSGMINDSFESTPFDQMRTPQQLMKMVSGQNQIEREWAINLCMYCSFLAGNEQVWKDLTCVRQAVFQRQQTNNDLKEQLNKKVILLSETADQFSRALLETRNNKKIDCILEFCEGFLEVVFRLEKGFSNESSLLRLEEMTESYDEAVYQDFTICSWWKKLKDETIIETTVDDDSLIVEQTAILQRLYEKMRSKPSQLFEGGCPVWEEDEIDESRILKKLKPENRKPPRNLSDYHRGFIKRNNGEAVGYTHPLQRSSMTNVRSFEPRDSEMPIKHLKPERFEPQETLQTSPANMKSITPRIPKKKPPVHDCSDESQKKPRIKSTKQPFVRMFSQPQVHKGKNFRLFKSAVGKTVMLLHAMCNVVRAMKVSTVQEKKNILSSYQQADEKLFLRMLRIIVPLVNHIKQTTELNGTMMTLKKSLERICISYKDDMLAVSIYLYHNKKFCESAKAVYKYIENISDITFCGEPFSCDLIEVGQELLDDKIITKSRYEEMLILVARCHMNRGHYKEALVLWNEVLQTTRAVNRIADSNSYIAECCLKLNMSEEGMEAAQTAIEIYHRNVNLSPLRDEYIERLENIIIELK